MEKGKELSVFTKALNSIKVKRKTKWTVKAECEIMGIKHTIEKAASPKKCDTQFVLTDDTGKEIWRSRDIIDLISNAITCYMIQGFEALEVKIIIGKK